MWDTSRKLKMRHSGRPKRRTARNKERRCHSPIASVMRPTVRRTT